MDKLILTDVDGVLLNWNSGFDMFMSIAGYPRIEGTDDNYLLSVRHGISELEAYKLASEFNNTNLIGSLNPLADSVYWVRRLHEQGFKFIAISSLSKSDAAHGYRSDNLKMHFGDAIDELICLDTGAPKRDTLERWRDSKLFWIEDHYKNAIDGVSVGLRSILVDQPYNRHLVDHDKLLYARVSHTEPWRQIYCLINDLYLDDEINQYHA